MKANQIVEALRRKFEDEGARLVFWDDPSGEFADFVAEDLPGELEPVKILDRCSMGGLSAKLLLEREDPQGQYLVYRVGEESESEADWLLDIRLYSAGFHADMASLWLQELGLQELRLRDYLNSRKDFLRSQERRSKLKELLKPGDDEEAIDGKMLAVLAGCQIAHLFVILRSLCHLPVSQTTLDLGELAARLTPIEKMGLADRFWGLVQREFGYHQPSPSLAGLLRHLFVSEMLHKGSTEVPSLHQFKLQSDGSRNAVGCLDQWRDSATSAPSYDAAAAAVASELRLGEPLKDFSLDALKPVFTFFEAEQQVVAKLMQAVLKRHPAWPLEAVRDLATNRKAGYWLAGPGKDQSRRKALADAYDAIVAAAELFELDQAHEGKFSFASAELLFDAYAEELHRFDALYRCFHTRAHAVQALGWDLLKPLAGRVEEVYDQGFLVPLGLEWSRLLDEGFLEHWGGKEISLQERFYRQSIAAHLDKSERHRAYVVISDAFRYEAAVELAATLRSASALDAKVEPRLGVLPSYTALGMAALLPHESLGYTDLGEVLVDGAKVSSTEARDKQLAKVSGMACQAGDLLEMKSQEARDFVHGKRVIYIYHNVIDARGDHAATEEETFAAVEQCIQELQELVRFCINKLNAGTVWITADHGFLFQKEAPDQTDKSSLTVKPPEGALAKKRFVLARDLGPVPEAHHGSTAKTAATEDEMEFWIPRGANRFHFKGGARFVHGGAMPQEVVIPVVTVKELSGKKKGASQPQKVGVSLLGGNHKITTPIYRFEFIQTEAVGERRLPLTVRVAVYDQDLPVTIIETLTFDSQSDRMDDRKREVLLELTSREYDKQKPYHLVLRDAETDRQVLSARVKIDRSFDDPF